MRNLQQRGLCSVVKERRSLVGSCRVVTLWPGLHTFDVYVHRHHADMRACLYVVRQHCKMEGIAVSYTVEQVEKPAEYICMDAFHGN